MVAMKKLKKLGLVLIGATMILAGCESQESKGNDIIKIGISQIAQHPALDEAKEGFIEALEDNGYKDNDNIEIDFQNAQGDIANSQLIAQNFVSKKKDMIFAIGTPAAQSAANATSKTPILITAVTDPVKAGLVENVEKTGTNVAGTSDAVPIDNQLGLMKQLIPDVKNVGILYNTSEINSEVQVIEINEAAKKHDMQVIAAGVNNTNEVSQALQSIIGKVDVVYSLTDNIIASSIPLITNETTARNIAVIGAESAHVEAGALATEGINYRDLGYETGLMAVKVMQGEDISNMSVSTLSEMELVINEKAAKELSIEIPEELKSRAKLIGGN